MATPPSPGGRLKETSRCTGLPKRLLMITTMSAVSPRSRPMMPQMSAAYSRPESSSGVDSNTDTDTDTDRTQMAEPEEEGD